MGVSRLVGAGLGVALAASAAMPGAMAAETGAAAFQGAWLASGPNCGEVYASAGKGASFKRPIDIFAPAFVIYGNRLRTPMASCRIKAVRPAGDRQVLVLDCANAVADQEVKVLMAPSEDGSLRRYFNEDDKTGTTYQRCSP